MCEPESGHLYSILPVYTFALPSSRCMTPHSHDDALAKRQFGSFPLACHEGRTSAMIEGRPPFIHLSPITFATTFALLSS